MQSLPFFLKRQFSLFALLTTAIVCFPHVSSADNGLVVLEIPVETVDDNDAPAQDLLQGLEIISTNVDIFEAPQETVKKEEPETVPRLQESAEPEVKLIPTQEKVFEKMPAADVESAPVKAVEASPDIEPDLFFDADDLVPGSEMVPAAPRKVDPSVEPGSRFVVVRKEASADSKKASMVTAERAMNLGRYDSALQIFQELHEKNKNDPNILMGMAQAYQKAGKTDQAIKTYDEILKLVPKNIESEVNMLGLMGQRYPSVALRRLLELYDENPGHVAVAAQVAVVQAALAQYDEALYYLGVAASKEPQNANHLFNMAVISDRTGRQDDAVRYYEEALELDTVYGGGRSIPRDAVYERLASLR